MIGFFRLGLALVVMAGHTGAIPILWSRFAVLGFYDLAGYFGAMSLNRSGRASFLLSRYGRVWPTFAVVFLACSAALWLGFEPRLGTMGLPLWGNWLRQALLLPASVPYVVASAWMLPHMMMGLGWAGHRREIAADAVGMARARVGIAHRLAGMALDRLVLRYSLCSAVVCPRRNGLSAGGKGGQRTADICDGWRNQLPPVFGSLRCCRCNPGSLWLAPILHRPRPNPRPILAAGGGSGAARRKVSSAVKCQPWELALSSYLTPMGLSHYLSNTKTRRIKLWQEHYQLQQQNKD